MIDYSPFWETLEKSNENWYTLTSKHHMSHSTLHRLKHNKDISTKTLNDLCRILNCKVEDVCKYVPSDDDQILQQQGMDFERVEGEFLMELRVQKGF